MQADAKYDRSNPSAFRVAKTLSAIRDRINIIFERKIVNILLPISLNICLVCSKERLIETVLLSTHNIMFWLHTLN